MAAFVLTGDFGSAGSNTFEPTVDLSVPVILAG